VVTVASIAHRNLRRWVQAYHDVRDQPQVVGRHATAEDVVGVYENPPGIEPGIVVITERGLSFALLNRMTEVSFDALAAVSSPPPNTGARVLTLTHTDGSTTNLAIAGRRGQFQDIYLFAEFLMGVIRLRAGAKRGG
jgi:hypothetical protein